MSISEKTVTTDQRKHLHRMFTAWLLTATDEEVQAMAEVRQLIAPNEVCSIIRIAITCLANPVMFFQLPVSFQQSIKAENWPLGYAVS